MLIDLATLEADRAHAEADARAAEALCAAALQPPCNVQGADIAMLDAAAPIPGPAPDLHQRADIRALTNDAQASQELAQLAAARAVPDLTFRLGYKSDRSLYLTQTIGARRECLVGAIRQDAPVCVRLGRAARCVGLLRVREPEIEAFPDPTDTQVQVITVFDGQPPKKSSAASRCRSSARSTAHPAWCACAASHCLVCHWSH